MTDEFDKILRPFRDEIDSLDKEIVDLLVKREKIIREVANVKFDNNVPAILKNRVNEVLVHVKSHAQKKGTDGQYVEKIYTDIIHASCDLETIIFTNKKTKS